MSIVYTVSFVLCTLLHVALCYFSFCFFFQAEDGIRDLVRSRGLGDVYKRQVFRDLADLPLPENIGPAVSHIDDIRIFAGKMKQYLSLIHI